MKIMICAVLTGILLAGLAAAETESGVRVSDLSLDGEIEGENIVFTLSLRADVHGKNVRLPLVIGDVAYMDGRLPKRSKLVREGEQYVLEFQRDQRAEIVFRFASRSIREGDWRRTVFAIPVASVRKLSVICDRDDLEVLFPGALEIERGKTGNDKTEVTAFLGVGDDFEVRWKPQIRKLEAELVVSCDANTIASASVGALRLDTVFTYRVIQGTLEKLSIALPEVNVTQVNGPDIQDWHIDRTDPDRPMLQVSLSRPRGDLYRLRVESEMILPEFPCTFNLPVLAPEKVIRTSGFLLIGTDSAIKLQVDRAGGVTQVDQASFTAVQPDAQSAKRRPRPTRSTYAYQYANTPYRLKLRADDIVTSISADDRLVLLLADNELSFAASVEIDVKDAPARELLIEIDPDPAWTVTSVTGKNISEADTDVRDSDGRRMIYIPFREAVSGAALIDVRMEKSPAAETSSFNAPLFKVVDARSERGYLVLAAEKGIRLKARDSSGLREVHTGSAPMRVAGAQQAFRFKQGGWRIAMAVERTIPSLHTEVFHLASLGEGVLYCSAAITYHTSGAPIQEFKVRVPTDIETVEFSGADMEGWTRSGDICTVRLHTRIMGDYTLLATYDRQFDYEEGEDLAVGDIETVGAESEVGYIVLASSASLKLTEAGALPPSIIRIEREEVPPAYSSPVTDPIIGSYKYVRAPHRAVIRVEPYRTEQLLGQIADYVQLATAISKDGEALTTATYYIKNASRQYLVTSLPNSLEPWSIKLVDHKGNKQDVLSQESEAGILIPIQRPRDQNTALRVEIVYAQSMGELGFWRSGVRGLPLRGPSLPVTHATFASWRFGVPEGFTIASARGNMSASREQTDPVLLNPVRMAWRVLMAAADGPGGRTVKSALKQGWGGPRSAEYTRTVNLSGEEQMAVRLFVVPDWTGAGGSARYMAVALVAGALLTAVGVFVTRHPVMSAAGLTVLVLGIGQAAAGRAVLAAALVLAVAIVLGRLAARFGLRAVMFVLRTLRRAAAAVALFAWRSTCAAARVVAQTARHTWTAWHAARERVHLRRLELEIATRAEAQAPFAGPGPDQGSQTDLGTGGGLVPGTVLLLVAALSMLGRPTAAEPVPVPVMDSVTMSIEGPGTGHDVEQSAKVRAELEFRAPAPVSFSVVPADGVLTGFELHSRHLAIASTPQGYTLNVKRKGKYHVRLEFRIPVAEINGRWQAALHVPRNIRNSLAISLPEPGLDIQSDSAVLFRTWKKAESSHAEAVFGPVTTAAFTWRPRIRRAKLEEAVFFCEVNTLAHLRSGVVDLTNLARYQVAQGEIRELKVLIPPNMSVTAVRAPGLATWSFDADTRLLDAILEKPVAGDFTLSIVTQIACDGLPYDASIGVPRVLEALRQRGAVAISALDTVQVSIGETAGLNQMNVADFSPATLAEAGQSGRCGLQSTTVRRAFRYHLAEEVSVSVHTEQVLPEIRVVETGTLSIADDRIVLASKLGLGIAKAGIFWVTLDIPDDYDVETLTGRDVSHWDEADTEDSGTPGSREITVHFSRQVTDSTEISLVAARMEKGIEAKIPVPRVVVEGTRKHTGKLTISGERGVRLMVESHRGVDIKKASDEGITQAGVLVFDILRPTWALILRTEVMEPLVKPAVLQWVDLSEGMLQCRAYIRYKIENAGIKTLMLKSPMPGATLSVTGRNIARAHEVDAESGIWQIDLHSKVENMFAMTATCQVPYDPAERGVVVKPLKTLDTEGQRGYVVITCGGRMQVQPAGDLRGLKVEDPRNIPAVFGAGDLSGAILCYRTVRADYDLNLSVVRHKSADVLPATINRARLTSVVSTGGKLLTRVQLDMTVGDLRFLKLSLPHEADRLWMVLVNGSEVSVSRDEQLYCVPLEAQKGGGDTTVDLIYAGRSAFSFLRSRREFGAPRFQLPLNAIEWDFFVLPGFKYRGFGGTMEYGGGGETEGRVFDTAQYREWNEEQREASLRKARFVLDAGEDMVRAGRQKEAKKAFQQALSYSQGQADLNEDARIQFRNLVKQQVKIGLVNRRDAVRFSRNIIDERQLGQMAGFKDGDYTQAYAARVEKGLSKKDNDALEVVAGRIIDQQAAAAGIVKAISITMPEHGLQLRFTRERQIDPDAELTVTFHAWSGRLGRIVNVLWSAIVLFGILWIIAARVTRAGGHSA